jgi:phytoene/squalene synthetase
MTMDRQAKRQPGEAPTDPISELLPQPASSVTLEAEVPEVLFHGMRDFIDAHPHWDQYSVITSALAGFLFQNGCQEQSVTQHYLDGLFLRP